MFSNIAWLIFLRESLGRQPYSPNGANQVARMEGRSPFKTKTFEILVRESGVWTPFEKWAGGQGGVQGKESETKLNSGGKKRKLPTQGTPCSTRSHRVPRPAT